MSQKATIEVQITEGIEAVVPCSEVKAQAERRRFPTKYKVKILAEAEKCTDPGELGAMLRREGLYDSHLWRWRKAQREGRLGPGSKGGQKGQSESKALKQEVAKLEAENARLKKSLEQAELVIDVQKKLSMLLGLEVNQGNGQS